MSLSFYFNEVESANFKTSIFHSYSVYTFGTLGSHRKAYMNELYYIYRFW